MRVAGSENFRDGRGAGNDGDDDSRSGPWACSSPCRPWRSFTATMASWPTPRSKWARQVPERPAGPDAPRPPESGLRAGRGLPLRPPADSQPPRPFRRRGPLCGGAGSRESVVSRSRLLCPSRSAFPPRGVS